MNNLTTILFSVVLFINLNIYNNNEPIIKVHDSTLQCNIYSDHGDPIVINNADLGIIFPGDSNEGRLIPKTRINPTIEDLILTGIKSADHGTKIIIYATNGSITLLPNNLSSSVGNRIEGNSNMIINQGDFAELTYNANIGKWVIDSIE